MLHEITKGMDNAAQAINANFKNATIVESNLDETNPSKGHYVIFGNGLMMCWHTNLEATYDTNARLTVVWQYPKEFTVQPVAFAVRDYAHEKSEINSSSVGIRPNEDAAHIRLFSPYGQYFVSGDKTPVRAVAIGIKA